MKWITRLSEYKQALGLERCPNYGAGSNITYCKKEVQSVILQWKCEKCGTVFTLADSPKFCPVCGCGDFINAAEHKKAKQTAEKICHELSVMIPEIEAAWNKYAQLQARYEEKVQTLRQYKHRGIITEEEIPKPNKKQVQTLLREIRANKKR